MRPRRKRDEGLRKEGKGGEPPGFIPGHPSNLQTESYPFCVQCTLSLSLSLFNNIFNFYMCVHFSLCLFSPLSLLFSLSFFMHTLCTSSHSSLLGLLGLACRAFKSASALVSRVVVNASCFFNAWTSSAKRIQHGEPPGYLRSSCSRGIFTASNMMNALQNKRTLQHLQI